MPYISYAERTHFDNATVPETQIVSAGTAGQLNYQITRLVMAYVKTHKQGYQTFNDALGALEGAKLEFYRRVVVPYEEQKRFQNGDVYV